MNFKEISKKPTKYFSSQQERRIAKSLDGTNDLQSGGGKFNKADVILEEWVIEAKTKVTPQESMTIHKDWFIGVEKDRSDMKKSYAAVCFSFGDGKDYYAMDERTFKFLLAISRGQE